MAIPHLTYRIRVKSHLSITCHGTMRVLTVCLYQKHLGFVGCQRILCQLNSGCQEIYCSLATGFPVAFYDWTSATTLRCCTLVGLFSLETPAFGTIQGFMKVTLCQVYLGRIALQTAITTITKPVTVPACDAASNAYSSCKNLYRAISSHVSATKKTRNSMHNSFNTKDSFLRSSMISAKCLSYHFVHINLKADWNAIQNKPFYWQKGKRLLACRNLPTITPTLTMTVFHIDPSRFASASALRSRSSRAKPRAWRGLVFMVTDSTH